MGVGNRVDLGFLELLTRPSKDGYLPPAQRRRVHPILVLLQGKSLSFRRSFLANPLWTP